MKYFKSHICVKLKCKLILNSIFQHLNGIFFPFTFFSVLFWLAACDDDAITKHMSMCLQVFLWWFKFKSKCNLITFILTLFGANHNNSRGCFAFCTRKTPEIVSFQMNIFFFLSLSPPSFLSLIIHYVFSCFLVCRSGGWCYYTFVLLNVLQNAFPIIISFTQSYDLHFIFNTHVFLGACLNNFFFQALACGCIHSFEICYFHLFHSNLI